MTMMVDKQLNCSEDGHNNMRLNILNPLAEQSRQTTAPQEISTGLSRRYVQMGQRRLSIREYDD